MEHLPYFIAAYFVFWLATTVYLFSIEKRQREVSRKLDKLLG